MLYYNPILDPVLHPSLALTTMTYRYIPPHKKELLCDMAKRVDSLQPLFDTTGFGHSTQYRWLAKNRQTGYPAV
jgi:hypothetical protein